jgi:LemA protein
MLELVIFCSVILALVVWIYNLLVKDRNQVLAAWSDIDVQLKRRHDLIPQLLTTVKAYANFEKATLTAVIELRSRSEATTERPVIADLEDQMQAAIGQIIVVAEDYPDLKADENFRQLQSELTDIEDHLQYARRFYNGAVRIFNTRIQSFPHFLIAKPCRFKVAEFFEVADAAQRSAQSVDLS